MCKERSEENRISSIDFFKTSFWGEPIPSSKIDRIINMNIQERNLRKVHLNTKEKPLIINYCS